MVWTSSNESIAKVDNDGVVTGFAIGDVVITANSVKNENIKDDFAMKITIGKGDNEYSALNFANTSSDLVCRTLAWQFNGDREKARSILVDGAKYGTETSVNQLDSWAESSSETEDYWGLKFETNKNFNKLTFAHGAMFPNGGWFEGNASGLKIQYKTTGGEWVDVENQQLSPTYSYDNSTKDQTYTFTFDDCVGSEIRLIGDPVSFEFLPSEPTKPQEFSFTTVSEIEVYYEENVK